MKPKRNFQFSIGWSSILMIFVVLCLTAFGILSYVTANADYKLSAKTALTVQDYYEASQKSEKKLQAIDTAVLRARTDAKSASSSGSCAGLANREDYERIPAVESVLKSAVPISEKYKMCCAVFSRVLLSKLDGVTLADPSGTSLPLNGTFSVAADQNRKIQVSLVINPLADTDRCKVESSRLVDSEETEETEETESEPTLNLWQGNKS